MNSLNDIGMFGQQDTLLYGHLMLEDAESDLGFHESTRWIDMTKVSNLIRKCWCWFC